MAATASTVAGLAGLDAATASRYARIALDNVVREYPNKLDHLMGDAGDVRGPAQLHPVFYGSYDWHSCVHMHWSLVTLLHHYPDLPDAADIVALLDRHFTTERIAGEIAYLRRPSSATFERPYGWAWMLKLGAGLHGLAGHDRRAVAWRDRLQPLVDAVEERVLAYLPHAADPARAGSHGNSAFALMLMLDYATIALRSALQAVVLAKSATWYANDRDYPIEYETGSEDFLSNGLLEAALMHRVICIEVDGSEAACLSGDPRAAIAVARFSRWWDGFVPDIARLSPWLKPKIPGDRSDARLTHIDGLNLSRAWCWGKLLPSMPDALRTSVQLAIHNHRRESLPHVADGHYVGTHWLASFALLAHGA